VYRFKQIGISAVGQFQVGAQGRIQIGQHFAANRDAVVALLGIVIELFWGQFLLFNGLLHHKQK
jgi:hypothetical protein